MTQPHAAKKLEQAGGSENLSVRLGVDPSAEMTPFHEGVEPIGEALQTPIKPGALVLLGVENIAQNTDISPGVHVKTAAREILTPYDTLISSLLPATREQRFTDTLVDILLGGQRTKRWRSDVLQDGVETQYEYALRYRQDPVKNVPLELEMTFGSDRDDTLLNSWEGPLPAELKFSFRHGEINAISLFWKAADPQTILGLANQTESGKYLADFIQKYFATGECGDTTSYIQFHLNDPSIVLFQQVSGKETAGKQAFEYAELDSVFELGDTAAHALFQRTIRDLPMHEKVVDAYGISLDDKLSVNDFYKLVGGLVSLVPAAVQTWQSYALPYQPKTMSESEDYR